MLFQAHLKTHSELAALTEVQAWFEEFCRNHISNLAWTDHQLYRLNLALAEGFTNAVRHAHSHLPPTTPIELELTLWHDRMEIRIWDHGPQFNPDQLKEPQPGTLREGGYGWFLLRRLTDRVVYERSPEGRNCLVIVKQGLGRSAASSGG